MVTNYFLSVIRKRKKHPTDNTTIKITFVTNPNRTKNAGTRPINNAAVVIPKAMPGLFLSMLKHMAKVTLIVIEKKNTPIMETTISLSPQTKNGTAASVLTRAVFLAPKRSTKYPPRALPSPMKPNSITVCQSSLFHEMGIAYPR